MELLKGGEQMNEWGNLLTGIGTMIVAAVAVIDLIRKTDRDR